jgi:hypothetical protein
MLTMAFASVSRTSPMNRIPVRGRGLDQPLLAARIKIALRAALAQLVRATLLGGFTPVTA